MSTAAPLLDVRDVAKNFNSVIALRAASLAVRPGEVHALMGANGAGKSTLVKILTGVLPAEARRAGIFSVYQDPALVPDLTVAQNLRLARVAPKAVLGRLAELGIADLDLGAFIRDLPYPTLRLIDL